MRLGMLRRQLQCGVQRFADLAGDAHLQRLGDRQALAVAAQRERVAVVAVDLVRQCLDRGFGDLRRLLVALELFGFVIDQVGRVDAERLHRDGCTDGPERAAGIEGGLEVAGVERSPGILQGGGQGIGIELGRGLAGGLEQRRGALGVRERLAVAGVQFGPRLLQCLACMRVRLGVVREVGPTGSGFFRGHAASPVAMCGAQHPARRPRWQEA